jgi:hypothetical protein
MNMFDNLDDFEKSLKAKLEGKTLHVPEQAWPMVNASTLAYHLAKYKRTNQWLMGALGLMLTGLSATSWMLLQQKTQDPVNNITQLQLSKTDTIYVTKIKKIFVQIYLHNGYKSESKNIDAEGKLPQSLVQNEDLDRGDTQDLVVDNQAVEYNSNLQTEANELAKAKINKTDTDLTYLSIKPIQQKSYVFAQSIKNTQNEFLQSISTKVNPNSKQDKFAKQVALDFYIANENNFVDILRNDKKAFDYANQGSRSSKIMGGRAEIRLSRKWSILTGLEFAELRLEENDKSLSFTAENFFGIPSFLYRTAVGTIKIPNNNLNTNPKIGSTLNAESNDPLTSDFVKTTLGARFHIMEKSYRNTSKNPVKVGFYTQASGVLSVPIKQDVALSLSQINAASTFFSTNDIQNQNETFGLNFGVGLKTEIGKFGIFVEPSLSQSLSSMVKDMPIKTYLRSVGFKTGISLRLK